MNNYEPPTVITLQYCVASCGQETLRFIVNDRSVFRVGERFWAFDNLILHRLHLFGITKEKTQ
jgi:hypothetical protein